MVMSDKLRDMDKPMVLGYELDRDTLTPVRRQIDVNVPGDYGCDSLPNGKYRMVPSGDIVSKAERDRRLRT